MGFAREAADRIIFMDQGRIGKKASLDTSSVSPSSHERTRAFLDGPARLKAKGREKHP